MPSGQQLQQPFGGEQQQQTVEQTHSQSQPSPRRVDSSPASTTIPPRNSSGRLSERTFTTVEDQGSSSFAGFGNGVLSEVFNQIGIPRENNSNLQTNLYIRGLPENFSDEKLRELCAPYGKVLNLL